LKSFSGDPIKTRLGWKTWQRLSQPRANLFLQACLKRPGMLAGLNSKYELYILFSGLLLAALHEPNK